jgi:hypothetical protein
MLSTRTGDTQDGQVTITFDPTTDACPAAAAVIPTAVFTG